MSILISDLIKNPCLLEKLRGGDGRPLTADELHHDDPGLATDPLSEKSDAYFEALGSLVEKHPPVTAGIRRG